MRGVYVLVVSVGEPACFKVGALGRVSFRRGLYAYVGSGQAGLQKRVARHLRRDKNRF
jgi:Uri superfamily endonuclease